MKYNGILSLYFTFAYQTINKCVGVMISLLPMFNIHDTIYENSQSLKNITLCVTEQPGWCGVVF